MEPVDRNGRLDTVLDGIAIFAEARGWTLELYAADGELTLLRVSTGRKNAYAANVIDGDLPHAAQRLWAKLPVNATRR